MKYNVNLKEVNLLPSLDINHGMHIASSVCQSRLILGIVLLRDVRSADVVDDEQPHLVFGSSSLGITQQVQEGLALDGCFAHDLLLELKE